MAGRKPMEMKNQQEKKPPKLDQGYSLLAAKQNTSFYFEIIRFSIQHSVGWHLWCIFLSHICCFCLYSFQHIPKWINKREKMLQTVPHNEIQNVFRPTIAQSHRGFCNITFKRCTAHRSDRNQCIVYPLSSFWLLEMQLSVCEWRWFTEMNVQKKFHHGVLCVVCCSHFSSFFSLLFSCFNRNSFPFAFIPKYEIIFTLRYVGWLTEWLAGWLVGNLFVCRNREMHSFLENWQYGIVLYCFVLVSISPYSIFVWFRHHLMTSSEHFYKFKNHSKTAAAKRRRKEIDTYAWIFAFILLLWETDSA